ncbi:MAG TPA: oligosaccharide flippase family protein [Firmicutes bacterium]|nr:oligosaccharide flippase family protein [Bacillota bacterium]
MSSKTLFAKTPPIKLFFIAAIPGAVSMLASALYGLLDGIFVGQFLNETAFAALNLAFPFVVINFSLADLIGLGSAVPIAISLGKKEEQEANNIFSCACIMIVATGALIGGILYASAPALIGMLGAEGELAHMAVQYMRVYAICSPVTTIVFAMDNYLRICGQIKRSFTLNILMAVIGAVLEFTFLFVFKWGIWGAALATCSGMLICALLALYPFLRSRLQLRFCRPRFSLELIRQIITCGSPNFLNNIAGRITSILMNIVLLDMGGPSAVSIYGILMYLGEIVQPILYGVCDSLQPAVGYNWGAGNYARVKAIEKCCFTASAIVSVTATIIMLVIPEQLSSLFIKDPTQSFLTEAGTALQLFSLTYITRWFSFATQSYMIAVDKPVPASIISVSTALMFPLILIGALWPLKLTGLWLNSTVTAALAGILAVIVMLKFRKEFNRLQAQSEASIPTSDN